MKQYNYTGKIVYMGIDVHKKTYVCVSLCEGEIVKKDTMPAKPEILIQYIRNQFSDAKVKTAYEAGFSGFHLHRQLIKAGIENQVIHPGSLEVASRDRVKNDKRDATKIGVQLSNGRLKGVYVPSEEQEANRSMSRLRDNIVKLRHQVGQKLKALLFTQGLITSEDDSVLSQKWIKQKLEEIKTLNCPQALSYSINHYAKQWIKFTEDLKILKQDLIHYQSEQEQGLIMIYKSAPGIGDISAIKLKDELYDMHQFSNEKKLFSYIGFTPTEYSSGEHTRQGSISRQGRSQLRHIFTEAAWIAIRKDPSLMEIFQRIAKTRGTKKAIVGVARRLAGRLRSCVLNGTLYEIKSSTIKEEVQNLVSRDLVAIHVA